MVRRSTVAGALAILAIVGLIFWGATWATGEGAKEALKDPGSRTAFAVSIGAFLLFLVAWGVRDLLLRRKRTAARRVQVGGRSG